MKQAKAFLVVAVMYVQTALAVDGELTFRVLNLPSQTSIVISITQVSNTYSWVWDKNQNIVVPYTPAPFTTTAELGANGFKYYNSPTSEGTFPTIPWGVHTISIKSKDLSTGNLTPLASKEINFSDENWAKYAPYDEGSHDTKIEINYTGTIYSITIIPNDHPPQDFYEASNKIWEIWEAESFANDVNLLPHTNLHNYIEGQGTDFGTLKLNSTSYSSGAIGLAHTASSNTLQHETLDKIEGNTTYHTFKWELTPSLNSPGSVYSASKNFTTDNTFQNRTATRRFKPITSLTLKTNLLEAGGISTDNVDFKDPTTDNLYHPVSVSGSGFIMNDAFQILSEDFPSQGLFAQKYVAKAKNSFVYNGITYSWIDGDFTPSGTDIYLTQPATLTANYKGSLASNTSTAMNQPSQRKIVRGNTGAYILAYESMGIIWAEYSTNEGATWQLANNNQPIGGGTSPAITPNSEGALLVFLAGGNPVIYRVAPTVTEYYGYLDDDHDYTYTAPVICKSEYSDIIVMWKGSGGIRYSIGQYLPVGGGNECAMVWSVVGATLSGSNSGSSSPTVEAYGNTFHIAYQHIYMGSTVIFYTTLTRQANGTYLQSPTIQRSGSYTTNSKPSLIGVGTASGAARLCWLGSNAGGARAVFHAIDNPSSYWYFGTGVTGTSINKAPDGYVIGWSNNNFQYQYTDNAHLSNPQTLPISGNAVQIANSSSRASMKAVGYNILSSPYRFSLSSPIALYKSGGDNISKGRGGIVKLNGGEFLFLLGDITAGEKKIEFVEMPDTVRLNGAESLNRYLETEIFTLACNTPLNYDVEYWTADSAAAVAGLEKGKKVAFTVEMMDAKTNNVIGTFDKCTYNSSQVVGYRSQQYEVNTKGIEKRQVKLRLRVEASSEAEFAVVNAAAEGSVLAKEGSEKIKVDLSDALTVTTYALEQNYPNPFNPSTTITYQIPKDGMVTITIYDVLGREVQTLVNEEKTIGRYSVAFNASNLASGVYVYKIVAAPAEAGRKDVFTAVKKMVLLK